MVYEREAVMMVGVENIHIQHEKSRMYKTIPPETARHGIPDIIRVNGRGRHFYINKRRRLGYLNGRVCRPYRVCRPF
jgi:hypothetical protein